MGQHARKGRAGAGPRSSRRVARQAAPNEIIFTSGGSEANNLAIKGTFFALNRKGAYIITTAIEHPAVLAPCRFLERLGAAVTYLPVDRAGRVDPKDVLRAIAPQTVLISIMHANNEVGTIQPIEEIGAIERQLRRPVALPHRICYPK